MRVISGRFVVFAGRIIDSSRILHQTTPKDLVRHLSQMLVPPYRSRDFPSRIRLTTLLRYICFTVACALASNMNELIGFRFLQGCWSVAPLTIGAGSMADMVVPQHRGAVMSLWSLGPLLGPTIGPIAGGFVSQDIGWRWIFWIIAIATAVTAAAAYPLLSETYAPILLERKTKRLRRETGNESLRSKLDNGLGAKDLFKRAIVRPSKLLALSPICQLLSLYIAILYGMMYLLFTTFTFVYEDLYGFSESIVGLTFIGIGMGMLVGLVGYASTADRIYMNMAAKNNGVFKPEFRMPPLLWTTPTVPIGLFIYGWTAQYKVGALHVMTCSKSEISD